MRTLIIILSIFVVSACEQLAIKGRTQTIDSDYLSYLCIDNVKYIKTMNQTGHYSLTAKFDQLGNIENCRGQNEM